MSTKQLVFDGVTFQLEEFKVAGDAFNFRLIGTGKGEYLNDPRKYCLFYATGDEVELVKNFLLTIRDIHS